MAAPRTLFVADLMALVIVLVTVAAVRMLAMFTPSLPLGLSVGEDRPSLKPLILLDSSRQALLKDDIVWRFLSDILDVLSTTISCKNNILTGLMVAWKLK